MANIPTISTSKELAIARALGFCYGRLEIIDTYITNGLYKNLDDVQAAIQNTLERARQIEEG